MRPPKNSGQVERNQDSQLFLDVDGVVVIPKNSIIPPKRLFDRTRSSCGLINRSS